MKDYLIRVKNLTNIIGLYTINPKSLYKNLRSYATIQRVYPKKLEDNFQVSIIIVTHNAQKYIEKCLDSLSKFKPRNVEIIVVDNASDTETVEFLNIQKELGKIDVLMLCPENTYFSGGNNLGVKMSSENTTHLLLLNSDTEIQDKDWLDILMAYAPERGIISFGKADLPVLRPDGWCFLIDKQTYVECGGIDEYYKMNWGITDLTAKVGNKGYGVRCIINPMGYIKHFGQKSYNTSQNKKEFNMMSTAKAIQLFKNFRVELLKI